MKTKADVAFNFRLAGAERAKLERVARRGKVTPARILRTLIQRFDEKSMLREMEPQQAPEVQAND
jgi:hypothetical protein